MKFRNPLLSILLTVIFSLCFVMPTVAAEGNLGLSLQILQGDSSKSGLESNTRLWFVVEPGTSKSRTFIVQSTSAISEKISLSIGAVKRVNGQSQLAIGENSPIEAWASFNTNDFVLAPKAIKEIVMTFTVPVDEDVNSFSAMLLVKASGVSTQDSKDAYSVPGIAQIAAPIFLGVGTEDEFVTEFEIKDVFGINTKVGKALRVEIKNNGKTPVSIIGDVQVSGITFQTETLGPFNYETETIAPGESKFADAVVGDEIVEGKWRVYITASQGAVTETREFEKDITYTRSNSLIPLLVRIFIGIASLLLLLWAYRTFRPRTALTEGRTKNKKSKISEETRILIAELEAKTAALEAEVAKKSVRRKVAKKTPGEKLITGARVTKKVAVKTVAKKAVAKKSEK
jgi:hypothetical protein